MNLHKAKFLTCLLVGLFIGQAQSAESASFATQVEEVASLNQSDETSIYEIERVLLSEPEFNKLATDGDGNVDKCLSYLLESRHTPLQRRIAILAAYKATLSEWIRFSNMILDMHDNRLVDIEEVKDTILPRWFFSTYARDYFWMPSVRRVLWRMHDLKTLDRNTRGRIIDDLSGLNKLRDWLFGSGPF